MPFEAHAEPASSARLVTRRRPPLVLVTDGSARAALGTCRGLGLRGYDVATSASARIVPTAWSRFCSHVVRTPDPRTDTAGYVDPLAEAVSSGRFDALIPGTDQSLALISAARDRFEPHVRMGLPPHAFVLAALDKRRLAKAAADAGAPTPPTTLCAAPAELSAAADRLGYPVVVKPLKVVAPQEGGVARHGSAVVGDVGALRAHASTVGYPIALQPAVSGEVLSCAGVRAGRSTPAFAVSRAIRNWPPGRGGWSFSITVLPPPGLQAIVERLLDSLGWHGLFEVEVIASRDAGWATIDLNPRPYGSIALAIAAGANIPAVWVDWLLGCRARAPEIAAAGHSFRWEDAELRRAAEHFARREWRPFLETLRPRRHVAHAYFRRGDAKPLAARVAEAVASRATSGER